MGALKIAANIILVTLLIVETGLAITIINNYRKNLESASQARGKESFDDYISSVISDFSLGENKGASDTISNRLMPYILTLVIPITSFLLIWINVPRD